MKYLFTSILDVFFYEGNRWKSIRRPLSAKRKEKGGKEMKGRGVASGKSAKTWKSRHVKLVSREVALIEVVASVRRCVVSTKGKPRPTQCLSEKGSLCHVGGEHRSSFLLSYKHSRHALHLTSTSFQSWDPFWKLSKLNYTLW